MEIRRSGSQASTSSFAKATARQEGPAAGSPGTVRIDLLLTRDRPITRRFPSGFAVYPPAFPARRIRHPNRLVSVAQPLLSTRVVFSMRDQCSLAITALLSRSKRREIRFRSGFCSWPFSCWIFCGRHSFCLGLRRCVSFPESPRPMRSIFITCLTPTASSARSSGRR
jgi:hypothetical protein